jgi:hypothetical protein
MLEDGDAIFDDEICGCRQRANGANAKISRGMMPMLPSVSHPLRRTY